MEDLNALTGLYLPPRLIRLRDAPRYLGMDKNRFNREVRPHIISVPIGKQGIAFDRLDLDKWIDEYKQSHGRRPASTTVATTPRCQSLPRASVSLTVNRAKNEQADFAAALATAAPKRDVLST
jgi:hypothetical protein